MHPFFRHGISVSPALHMFQNTKMQLNWKDSNTVIINDVPFINNVIVKLKQKTLAKEAIGKYGLIKAYELASSESIKIQLR